MSEQTALAMKVIRGRIPQGTVLGLVLFNFLWCGIECGEWEVKFVDDAKLVRIVRTKVHCKELPMNFSKLGHCINEIINTVGDFLLLLFRR